MRSNRTRRQRGVGLVEVLVASALMAVALVVLLGSLSSLLIGSRVAERRTVEERLARAQIERIMAASCSASTQTDRIDGIPYLTLTRCQPFPGYVEITVTVQDAAGAALSISNDKVVAP